MKKRLLLSCLSISTIVFLSCTMSPPNTVLIDKNQSNNVSKNTKSFSTKGINSIKVPNVSNFISFDNYYYNPNGFNIYSKSTQLYVRGWGSECMTSGIPEYCTGEYAPSRFTGTTEGYYPGYTGGRITFDGNNNGLIYTWGPSGLSIRFYSSGLKNLEIGKEYDIPLEYYSGHNYIDIIRPVSGRVYLRLDKIQDDIVKINVIAENLEGAVVHYYYNGFKDYYYQKKIDYQELSWKFYTTFDEITLNIDKTELTSDSDKINISVVSSSDTRDWVLRIYGDNGNYKKEYFGTGNKSFTFPEQVSESLVNNSNYSIYLAYKDQSFLSLDSLVAINKETTNEEENNGEISSCENKINAQGNEYKSCFTCPEGQVIVFDGDKPISCKYVGSPNPEKYLKDSEHYYPYGTNGPFKVESYRSGCVNY